MNKRCFICNESSDILINYNNKTRLSSGKTLQEVLVDIVGDAVNKWMKTDTNLCNKCYEKCTEFHELWEKVTQIRSKIQASFLRSRVPQSATNSTKKMVCLPASKLKPLPSQYVILNKSELNTGKLTTPVKKPQNPTTINSKPITSILPRTPTKTIPTSDFATLTKQPQRKNLTIESSLLMSQLNNVKSNLTDEIADITTSEDNPSVTIPTSSLTLNTATSSSILNFDVDKLPRDFLDNAVLTRNIGDQAESTEVENNDEQPMEIDEDCSSAVANSTQIQDTSTKPPEKNNNKQEPTIDPHGILEMSILPDLDSVATQDGGNEEGDGVAEQNGGDDDFVVKKVEVLDDDDDENTLLVQGEDGSLIRVVAGQKYIYGDNEISLIIPQDEDNGDGDALDVNDAADSNDESHFELQVSGDEETANAIIAAAQEQGGAFIKVQSGEMYRVQSVKSKIESASEERKKAETTKRFSEVLKKVGNGYKCLYCAKEPKGPSNRRSYLSREAAVRHMRVAHHVEVNPPEKHARISIDGAQVPATSKKGGHQCQECSKTFGSRNLLLEHMNQHTGTRPYKCSVCEKTFASKYTYQAHLKTHEERPRPFRCSKLGCEKAFYTMQNLTQHEHTHEGIKSFKCQICDKSFGTAHNLEVHGVVHSGIKPFPCNICNKSFARKAEIRDHIRTHTGERPFVCDICAATFAQRSNLQSHVRATHHQDKRHACQHCEKKFKRRRLLEYHIKASHTGERPFKCEVCNATFVYPEHYKKHAWIHSGERPYVCEVCGKSFNSRDNRNAHRFVHSDKKPYECLVCGAGYMRKPLLYAHMHTSRHMTESIVVNQPRVSVEDERETNALFETVSEAELDLGDGKVNTVVSQEDNVTKVFITTTADGKIKTEDNARINLIQDSDTSLLTLAQHFEGTSKIEPSILASLANEELGKGAEIVANDENGDVLRLVQIQLPNGENGWIAIN